MDFFQASIVVVISAVLLFSLLKKAKPINVNVKVEQPPRMHNLGWHLPTEKRATYNGVRVISRS